MDVALRHDDVGREPAVDPRAERKPLRAEIGLAAPAEAARAAEVEVGLGGYAVAGRGRADPVANFCHFAGQLVAQDHRRLRRVLVVEDVQIGAADPRRAHGEQHLARARPRPRRLPQGDVALASRRFHDRLHRVHQRTSSSLQEAVPGVANVTANVAASAS